MTDDGKVFKYKLDFYYQSVLLYLFTLILYGGIRGNFVEAKFEYVLNDPLMYVIVFFVVMSIVALVLNLIRRRRLVITEGGIQFVNRFHERSIRIGDIEWMHVGREARVQTGGRFQVVVLKLKKRRRLLRIRIGRYERDRELVQEMNRIAAQVPKRTQRRWQRPKFTDR
ncbi:MAG: hypothetical protein ACKVRP_06755 [Bacteroidota bacterium]